MPKKRDERPKLSVGVAIRKVTIDYPQSGPPQVRIEGETTGLPASLSKSSAVMVTTFMPNDLAKILETKLQDLFMAEINKHQQESENDG